MITQLWDPNDALELGIPHSEYSRFFMYQDKGRRVFISISQMGDTLVCHVAADRKGKRILRKAILQTAQYLFMTYPKIKQLVSHSYMNSMKNLTRKCGFEFLMAVKDKAADDGEIHILRLARNS